MPTYYQTRKNERGAALILVLFASLLVLACALMLLLTTTMSTTNAISSTDEMQAYYAAEAGVQDALNVLRGNVAPHPDDGSKINFKNAINVGTSNNPSSGVPQLSRWLVYNYPTSSPNRVTLSPNYTPTSGIAYAITGISDPDNSREVIYSTAGGFNANSISTSASSLSLGGGVSITYTPQSSTNITTNGSPALGTIAFSGVKNNTNIVFATAPLTFTLQITEAGPLPYGTTTPIATSIKGTFSGSITSTSSIVSLNFANQSIEIPGAGTFFTMPSQSIQI